MNSTSLPVSVQLTGHTAYSTGVEAQHAQDHRDSLFFAMLEEITGPFQISGVESDKLNYVADLAFMECTQTFLESVEHIYLVFMHLRNQTALNRQCVCLACGNVQQLDLCISVDATEASPEPGKARFSREAADRLGLIQRRHSLVLLKEVEKEDDLLEYDLAEIWQMKKRETFHRVEPEEAWLTTEMLLQTSPYAVWEAMTHPTDLQDWLGATAIKRNAKNRKQSRTGRGTRWTLQSPKGGFALSVLDWRPFRYCSFEEKNRLGQAVQMTFEIERWAEGTRLTLILAHPRRRGLTGVRNAEHKERYQTLWESSLKRLNERIESKSPVHRVHHDIMAGKP